MQSGKNGFIGKKAYEIAYALWRVAAIAPEKVFADILRNKAMELVGFAADDNHLRLSAVGDALQPILKFAVDVNCITLGNAAILAREIGNLQSAISETSGIAGIDSSVNIADIFKEDSSFVEVSRIPRKDENDGSGNTDESGNPESGKKAEARQSAILERIRQSGFCRLADIQAILPGMSERTIRYDLESLVQRGLIERMGTGGRSVSYKLAGTPDGSETAMDPVEPVTNPPDLRYI